MRVVVVLALSLTLPSLTACSDVPSEAERGIDQDIRATRDVGPTISNLGLYDGPNMYDGGH